MSEIFLSIALQTMIYILIFLIAVLIFIFTGLFGFFREYKKTNDISLCIGAILFIIQMLLSLSISIAYRGNLFIDVRTIGYLILGILLIKKSSPAKITLISFTNLLLSLYYIAKNDYSFFIFSLMLLLILLNTANRFEKINTIIKNKTSIIACYLIFTSFIIINGILKIINLLNILSIIDIILMILGNISLYMIMKWIINPYKKNTDNYLKTKEILKIEKGDIKQIVKLIILYILLIIIIISLVMVFSGMVENSDGSSDKAETTACPLCKGISGRNPRCFLCGGSGRITQKLFDTWNMAEHGTRP